MKIQATDAQVQQIAANACTASIVMGMGYLQSKPGDTFSPDEFKIRTGLNGKHREINLDYVKGRMVKLWLREVSEGVWQLPSRAPLHDYQSWSDKYPTYEALALSVPGVKLL